MVDALHPVLSLGEKQTIIDVLRAHGIRRAALFGSFARGDAHPDSDIDLLIDPPPAWSLFDLSNLALALEAALHRPVDLVTYDYLNPRLAARILAQQEPLFAPQGVPPPDAPITT